MSRIVSTATKLAGIYWAAAAYTTSPKIRLRTVTAAQMIAGRRRYRPQMVDMVPPWGKKIHYMSGIHTNVTAV